MTGVYAEEAQNVWGDWGDSRPFISRAITMIGFLREAQTHATSALIAARSSTRSFNPPALTAAGLRRDRRQVFSAILSLAGVSASLKRSCFSGKICCSKYLEFRTIEEGDFGVSTQTFV